jgi:hypothetical protein
MRGETSWEELKAQGQKSSEKQSCRKPITGPGNEKAAPKGCIANQKAPPLFSSGADCRLRYSRNLALGANQDSAPAPGLKGNRSSDAGKTK